MPGRFYLDFTVTGETAVARKIQAMGMRIMNPLPAFTQIVQMMEDDIEELFESEGASSGKPWAPLEPATIVQKIRKGQNVNTLTATERLRDSLTGGEGGATKITPVGIDFGSEVTTESGINLAALHRGGTYTMPARDPVDFNPQQILSYVKVLERYIVEGLAGKR